jgi:hypothetical protein
MAKMSGISSLSAGPTLDTDRAHQHQPANALRRFGGHFGRNPSADRTTDDVEVAQIQPIHLLKIELGDIVDAIEPIGQVGFAEARMRGGDQSALCR